MKTNLHLCNTEKKHALQMIDLFTVIYVFLVCLYCGCWYVLFLFVLDFFLSGALTASQVPHLG